MGKEEIDHMAIDDSHPEKDLGRSSDEPETHLAETAGRRPSMAANIIKNPLQVGYAHSVRKLDRT